MRTHREPAAGYTLVELAVVIAIIAIFLAYAIPSYKATLVQNRIGSEINDINTDLQMARSAAIKQGVPVVICPSTNVTATTPTCSGAANWETGWIIFTDIANNQTFATASGDTLIRVHAGLQAGDTVSGTVGTAETGPFGGSLNFLGFNRMGGASIGTNSKFGALSVHDSGNTLAYRRCVVLSNVGMTYLKSQLLNAGVCP
ncbi:GspH/FimT family pseudopilin [Dyella kyungheensis]|uniref:Type II secretion system protein H n=1 Tax=Dyella kyungheensis TaxID=1242174 RepID=A0ABS2JPB2_9GAMM|nr:GspH/FimT family pseudopilin [Dyella kyungheensis]MBM7120706.1 GspH/FimT family pseudopilin [Dyella kyungheensis]